MPSLAPASLLAVLLLAAPAWASGEESTPGGSAASGFPIALVVLALAAIVLALVWRTLSKKKGHG